MIIPDYFTPLTNGTEVLPRDGQHHQQLSDVDPLLLRVSDEELLQEITERMEAAEPLTNQLRKSQQVNRDYYFGDQLRSFDLLEWQLPVVENRIFMSVEVLIPLVTANTGDPDIHCLAEYPGQEQEVSNYIDTLTSMLIYDYDVTYRLKDKVREIVRRWFVNQIGVGKFRYDKMTGKPVFDTPDPRNILVPTPDTPRDWVIEYRVDTIRTLLKMFPKAKEALTKKYWREGEDIPEEILGTLVGYYEYWRHSFVAWKLDEIILDKMLNPNWDWHGEKKKIGEEVQELQDGSSVVMPVVELFKYRVLDRPRHPYFFFNHFRLDGLDYDQTGYIAQARPLQDLINKRKRQISALADDSGLLIASGAGGAGIKKSEFEKYDGSPRSTLWIRDGNPNAIFARLSAAPISSGMIEDLRDSRTASDNIFGTQDVTRGENTNPNESGAARTVLRQGDISRIGPIAEAVEDFLQQVYLYDIQMRMLYTQVDYVVPQATPTDTGDYQVRVFNRDKVPCIKVNELIVIDGQESMESYMKPIPITLRVRRNSTLPKDPVSEYQRQLTLLQAGLSDPLTALEKMGEVDPPGKLMRLLKFRADPLSLLPPEKRAELQPEPPAVPPAAPVA